MKFVLMAKSERGTKALKKVLETQGQTKKLCDDPYSITIDHVLLKTKKAQKAALKKKSQILNMIYMQIKGRYALTKNDFEVDLIE